MTKNTQYINTYNKKRKMMMISGFGNKCQCCGYDKCVSALEFHHLDPTKKELTLSRSILSWEKTKQELKKCICVCANCHREIHDDLREIDVNREYFNEELVHDYNPKKCSSHFQPKYDWNNIDIIDMIENKHLTIQNIANKIGCSYNTIKRRYKKLKKRY